MKSRAPAVLLTLALAYVAACGGSDAASEPSDTDAPNESTAPAQSDAPAETGFPSDSAATEAQGGPEESAATEPTVTEVPAPDPAADAATAEAALLTLSDFPAGWSEVPDEEDNSNQDLLDEVFECLGPDAVELFNSETKAETGSFTDPADDSTVDQTVVLAATVESAEAYIAGGSADGVAECLTTAYREGTADLLADDEDAAGIELGEITVGALNVGEIGDGSFAYRIKAEVSSEGFTVDIVSDFVAVRTGRSVAGLNFFSAFDPTPIERITEYTTLAASRLPGAGLDSDADSNDAPATTDPAVQTTAAPPTAAPVQSAGPASPDASPFVGSFGDVAVLELPTGTPGEVAVIAQTAGLDRSGSLPVVVRNNTDSAVSGIELTGRARLDGALAATGSSQGFEPAIVEPGEIAFGYVYFDYDAEVDGAEFELSVSSDDGAGFNLPAVIDELTATDDGIVGIVTNQGSTAISGPIGVATACFDATGNFSGHATSYTDEDEIAADGGTASFNIDLYDDTVSCDIGLVAASGYDF